MPNLMYVNRSRVNVLMYSSIPYIFYVFSYSEQYFFGLCLLKAFVFTAVVFEFVFKSAGIGAKFHGLKVEVIPNSKNLNHSIQYRFQKLFLCSFSV